ncbi:MAG TPA: adenylate/guanylate cyclase domain-containing protein [Bacteroidota bacterium]|nr:adenylate/guanylate cyclase domain-containing protein [Bacteroidota bacterium]
MRVPISKSIREYLTHIGISLLVATFVLLLTQDILGTFPPLKRAELSLVDLRFRERGSNTAIRNTSNVIIVEISQESFKSLPEKWPWPRSYYTRLIRNLKRAGAKAIGLDVILTSGDSQNPHNDVEFRKALHETGNVVLAGKIETDLHRGILHEHNEQYGNVYIDSSVSFGLVNAREDVDGVLRRSMPFIYDESQQQRVPTFSMAVLNCFLNLPRTTVARVGDEYFEYANRSIPKYDPNSYLINYYGPANTFRRVNIADVLDDKDFETVEERATGTQINTFDDPDNGYLYDGTFTGKIVLIGSTMPEDKDLFPVSIAAGTRESDNKMYGVEIHANIIQNILDKNFIVRQPFWMTALVVFGLSLFTFVFTAALKAIRTKYSLLIELLGIAIVIAELFIIYWASIKLFVESNFLADMTSPFLAVIICYIGSTVYNYVTERKQKALIKSMFSRYVNPTIVEELVAHPEKLRLGGERKVVTVFFSDIEHFTQLSEKMSPEYLVTILNEYLNIMTSIILFHNGTLDKYEGDAIVAFWGAPIQQDDHPLSACSAALQMQKSLIGLNKVWQQEGKPELSMRIGINTGEVIVGNMGGSNRFDYTVIGDSVNLGARLESANKQYHTGIMISESTYKQVEGKVLARELDLLVVAGKTEPIRVYELIDTADVTAPPATLSFLESFAAGLKHYRCRQWDEAARKFQHALSLMPDDYASRMYFERTVLYKNSPPPDDWNGVFVLTTK